MDELINQQQLVTDLNSFDIDDYLMKRKEQLDEKIRNFNIKVEVLKLSRGKK